MAKEQDKTPEQVNALLQLQDGFANAHPSQDMLGDIPVEALPEEYRGNIRFRQDSESYWVAYSSKQEDLTPVEGGFMPNAHIRKIPAMTGPRRTGSVIKEWVDKIREAESKKE